MCTNRYDTLPFLKLAKIKRVQIVECNFSIFNLHHAPIDVQCIPPNNHARIDTSARPYYLEFTRELADKFFLFSFNENKISKIIKLV